ncbi:adenylate/guanylate cyclase domain-containing protein [Labrenzia sp. PO1]|uniref:CHASE2 domain-containing protein n=1 Tax=Labrenzia sp. PO1 TaxID=2720390 RepID=UPI0014476613|nr:adenylate/guanylate cyclase domain-containing protein [Labrenzia sp. PO1]NKI58989.1 adenylate/guanylate cyclase domain-containing protein [Labrenzia sp. PO1]
MKLKLYVCLVVLAMIVGAVWAGSLALGHVAGRASVLDRLETVLLDLRIHIKGPREAPQDVVIVAIDDQTVAAAGHYPVDRVFLTELVDRIRDAGAKALAIDILLMGKSNEAADTGLATALASLPTVIAAGGQFPLERAAAVLVPAPETELRPFEAFAEAASVGLVNVSTDAGGTPRHIPLIFKTDQGLAPSFGMLAVAGFLGAPPSVTAEGIRISGRVQSLDLQWQQPLNYYGKGGTIRTVSAQSLLQDAAAAKAALGGRLVLLGVTASAVGDRFSSPFDPILPGVEVLSTGIANLLDGSVLLRDSRVRSFDALAAVSITLLGMAVVVFLPLASATIVYLLLLLGWLTVVVICFNQGIWLNAALPIAASVPPVVALAVLREGFEWFRVRRLVAAREALSRFQAPDLARRIADDPGFLLVPREQPVAILFIDLAGYTALSEKLGPARTRDVLKAFHTLVVNEAARNKGLVLDFMGDGAMIGFGIPDAGPKDAADACRCAFDLVVAVRGWILASGLDAEIRDVRLGGHFGPVVLSRLGHENQQQIAATGDCVNVASRLMEVGKSRGASIVLSTALTKAAEVGGEMLGMPPRREAVAIRGRVQELEVALWTADEAMPERRTLSATN